LSKVPAIAFPSKGLARIEPKCVQILGRKIGTQIRTMTPDRAVFHQAVFEKNFLAAEDIISTEDRVA
jgi:hypothetical protein